MVKKNQEFFIWIPKKFKPKWKLEVTHSGGTDDITNRVVNCSWTERATVGTGTFKATLLNSDGFLTNRYSNDDTIEIYANENDTTATVSQFKGFIDFPSKDTTSKGNIVEIAGRHVGGAVQDIIVNKSYSAQEPSVILKDLIDTYVASQGFTYTNVSASSVTGTFSFDGKKFWSCVKELCDFAGFDCRIDNDKDFHFFESETQVCTENAVIMGTGGVGKMFGMRGFGEDTLYTKNKVTVIAQDDAGVPIIHTEESAGERTKQEIITDYNLKTYEDVKTIAESRHDIIKSAQNKGTVVTTGLQYLNVGELMWIVNPRQQIQAQYKTIQISQRFGRGGWVATVTVEKQPKTNTILMAERLRKEQSLENQDNIQQMEFSYNFPFNVLTDNKESSQNLKVSEGSLILSTGNEGKFTSNSKSKDSDVISWEARLAGENLESSLFEVSLDNGNTWTQSKNREVHTPSNSGNKIKVRITLKSDTSNPTPRLNSFAVLYK